MSYYLERVQRGVDYIEARLDEPIDLAEVAKAAGISRWHFQRIFKSLTGETLKTYVRSRRLAGSLDRLLTTQMRVLDIAMLAGFESQEAFARAFKKAFGLTPQAYRKLGDRSLFLKKLELDADYLRQIHANVSIEPEIYEQRAMLLVGARTLFYGADSEKNNIGATLPALWASFVPRFAEIPCRVPDVAYGVVRHEREDSDRLEYHAAVEVSRRGSVPEGLVAIEIPAATYARFAHRGAPSNVDHTVSYAYSTWLARSGMRHTYGPDLELYGPEYRAASDDSLMHYAIPIADAQDLPTRARA